MTTHAKLSASGSARWIACPGSVSAEAGLPNSSSPSAQEGTAAHELAELALTGSGSCYDWEGRALPDNNEHTVTREMADAVQVYVDYVKALGGHQLYEQRVDFSRWVPEGFGTSDAIVLVGDTLHIVDLKYGKGVRVDAYENTQGILYALGCYDDVSGITAVERVVITIVQPRLDHISEWSISANELLAWGERIAVAAEATQAPDAPRNPSDDACKFCKAKAVCPALADLANRITMTAFDDMIDAPPVSRLTDAQLGQALGAKKLIEGWLTAVEELVESRLMDGQPFPGFKLVAGRSLRVWNDEQAAEKLLIESLGIDPYTHKLISPSQAEKALGKSKAGLLADLISKPEGKPAVVPDSDKRQSIGASVDDFDCID